MHRRTIAFSKFSESCTRSRLGSARLLYTYHSSAAYPSAYTFSITASHERVGGQLTVGWAGEGPGCVIGASRLVGFGALRCPERSVFLSCDGWARRARAGSGLIEQLVARPPGEDVAR